MAPSEFVDLEDAGAVGARAGELYSGVDSEVTHGSRTYAGRHRADRGN